MCTNRRVKQMIEEINIFIAFGAGFLSFISPCVLPLYPAFLSYITGMSIQEINEDNKQLTTRSMLHTLFFLLGFSVVFIMFGFTSTFLSYVFMRNKNIIVLIISIVILCVGSFIVILSLSNILHQITK